MLYVHLFKIETPCAELGNNKEDLKTLHWPHCLWQPVEHCNKISSKTFFSSQHHLVFQEYAPTVKAVPTIFTAISDKNYQPFTTTL